MEFMLCWLLKKPVSYLHGRCAIMESSGMLIEMNRVQVWLWKLLSSIMSEITLWTYIYDIWPTVYFWFKYDLDKSTICTPRLARQGFEVMASRSWQYILCHWSPALTTRPSLAHVKDRTWHRFAMDTALMSNTSVFSLCRDSISDAMVVYR